MSGKSNSIKGFTLVELLLAMAFFSFILLFITTGFIIVNRAYTKGLTTKLVQDEGRHLMEQLTREIRVADLIETTTNCVAIDGTAYSWNLNADSSNPTHSPKILIRQENTSCSGALTDVNLITDPGVERILNERVAIQDMKVTQLSGEFYKIYMKLSTTETDIIDGSGAGATCSVTTGDQYCDIVEMTTVVSMR